MSMSKLILETTVECARGCRDRRAREGATTQRALARKAEQRTMARRARCHRVHSALKQAVNMIEAVNFSAHAVLQRGSSDQLWFLGLRTKGKHDLCPALPLLVQHGPHQPKQLRHPQMVQHSNYQQLLTLQNYQIDSCLRTSTVRKSHFSFIKTAASTSWYMYCLLVGTDLSRSPPPTGRNGAPGRWAHGQRRPRSDVYPGPPARSA